MVLTTAIVCSLLASEILQFGVRRPPLRLGLQDRKPYGCTEHLCAPGCGAHLRPHLGVDGMGGYVVPSLMDHQAGPSMRAHSVHRIIYACIGVYNEIIRYAPF